MLGHAKATRDARGEVAIRKNVHKRQKGLRALSAPTSSAVDRMSPDACKTGTLSAPAAVYTSILGTNFFSAVMVIFGAGGRSSNSACTAGRSEFGCRAHTALTTAGSRRSAGGPEIRAWTARPYDAYSANSCARAMSFNFLASMSTVLRWDWDCLCVASSAAAIASCHRVTSSSLLRLTLTIRSRRATASAAIPPPPSSPGNSRRETACVSM
jgi:hypothetical protein